MKSWLKNAFEEVLWFLFERPTTRMRQHWAEEEAKMPPHPKPGKTLL